MKDELGDKFKAFEAAAESVLEPGLPVFLRLDGNSFSKFTKGNMVKPFDARFEQAMNAAAESVLEYCSGVCFAYVQSDEITVLLRNDQSEKTTPFLANRTQKLASLTAAKASVAFNRSLREQGMEVPDQVFDCRAFTVPEEMTNSVVAWRQEDCFRNAIAGTLYWRMREDTGRKTAHNWMHGKGTGDYLSKLSELGVTTEDIGEHRLWGRVLQREVYTALKSEVMPPDVFQGLVEKGHIKDVNETVTRSRWTVLERTPRFNTEPEFVAQHMEKV